MRIPMPSIMASSTPPMTALPAMARGPLRAARIPPVAAPLMIEFQGSSFFRICTNVQSIVENMPPQTAKLPPMIGARDLIAGKEKVKLDQWEVTFNYVLYLLGIKNSFNWMEIFLFGKLMSAQKVWYIAINKKIMQSEFLPIKFRHLM